MTLGFSAFSYRDNMGASAGIAAVGDAIPRMRPITNLLYRVGLGHTFLGMLAHKHGAPELWCAMTGLAEIDRTPQLESSFYPHLCPVQLCHLFTQVVQELY